MTVPLTTLFHHNYDRTKYVEINGVEFKKEAAVVHSVVNDLPQVAKITSIYVINGSTTVFKADCFTTVYNPHLRSYILQPLHNQSFFYHDKLSLHLPLHVRSARVLPTESIVVMPYYIS